MILIVSASYGESAANPAMVEYRERMQPLLLKYGAERVSSARVIHTQPDDPRELHVTRFPSKAGFEAMMADPDYLAMEDLRKAAMTHIRIYIAEEYVTFID